MPLEDVERLEALDDRQDMEDTKRALGAAASEGAIPLNKLKKELGL